MKKIIFIFFIFFLLTTSCTKDNCAEQEAKLLEDYKKALVYSNGVAESIIKSKKTYDEKLKSIRKNCN